MLVLRRSAALAPRLMLAASTLLPPSVVIAQPGSPAGPVPVERLQARRAALLQRLGTGVAILRSADAKSNDDGDYPQDSEFRQDNDFFYLTGIETAGSWLVLVARDTAPDQAILYIPPRDSAQERWTGPKLVPGAKAQELTGIEQVRSSAEAEREIRALVMPFNSPARQGALYFKKNARARDTRLLVDLAFGGPARVEDLRPHLAVLRQVKDADEIARLRKAVDITTAGHLATWRIARPGVWERELEAEAEATFRRLGAERLGYPSIVGTGFNATTLHYDQNRAQLQVGELIVMDMGAEYGYYTADVTRTIPATGKFTARQRAIYDLVLATQQAAIDSIKPGMTLGQLSQLSKRYMRDRSGTLCGTETCDTYYIHGLSHWLGMDVHDVAAPGARLAPGMVFTVEPGIYIPQEKLGVRIEDVVLITPTGAEILSTGAPRKADEVERYMQRNAVRVSRNAEPTGSP